MRCYDYLILFYNLNNMCKSIAMFMYVCIYTWRRIWGMETWTFFLGLIYLFQRQSIRERHTGDTDFLLTGLLIKMAAIVRYEPD